MAYCIDFVWYSIDIVVMHDHGIRYNDNDSLHADIHYRYRIVMMLKSMLDIDHCNWYRNNCLSNDGYWSHCKEYHLSMAPAELLILAGICLDNDRWFVEKTFRMMPRNSAMVYSKIHWSFVISKIKRKDFPETALKTLAMKMKFTLQSRETTALTEILKHFHCIFILNIEIEMHINCKWKSPNRRNKHKYFQTNFFVTITKIT